LFQKRRIKNMKYLYQKEILAHLDEVMSVVLDDKIPAAKISKESGVATSVISRLRSGERDFMKIEVGTLLKLGAWAYIHKYGTGLKDKKGQDLFVNDRVRYDENSTLISNMTYISRRSDYDKDDERVKDIDTEFLLVVPHELFGDKYLPLTKELAETYLTSEVAFEE
jgi:hypothetical protein